MRKAAERGIARIWYGGSRLYWLLLPLGWLFALVVACRRRLYRSGLFQAYSVEVPVVVVGNISVGGTGKSPLAAWLAKSLLDRGRQPVLISRGFRGKVGALPLTVTADSDPAVVGDEAIMLAVTSGCPVVVHPERVAAAKKAIDLGAEIIIADDGLQHYRLARDLEIAVVDGARGFGNGQLLPAGPLREPLGRLDSVDKVVVQRQPGAPQKILRRASDRRPLHFTLVASSINRLGDSDVRDLEEFRGRKMHAIAGIAHPERFFRMLERHGIQVIRHPLPDHADISQSDLLFADHLDVLMTAKDAVKCRQLDTSNCWYVPVDVRFEGNDGELLLRLLLDLVAKQAAGKKRD